MKSGVRLLIISTLALIFFGVAAFFTRDLIFGGVVGTYEQAAADRNSYNDKWVSYDVVACLGKYAEATETTNLIPTGHTYYYVVWMKDGSFMPLAVSKKADREYLDALTNATYDYIDKKTERIEMDPKTFTGTVKSQETKAKNYYDEALVKMNILGKTTHKIYYLQASQRVKRSLQRKNSTFPSDQSPEAKIQLETGTISLAFGSLRDTLKTGLFSPFKKIWAA